MLAQRGTKQIRRFLGIALALILLQACGSRDQGFTLTEPGPVTNPGGGGPQNPPGPSNDCTVNFKSLIQLKVSANPAGTPLEVLDANPVVIAPIPIKVEGSKVTISGDSFPEFILTRLSQQADLRIKGVPGVEAVGSYDPATGAMTFDGFQLSIEILNKGTTTRFIDGIANLSGINFTTDSVTATGNLHSISEKGQPIHKDDLSMTLVTGFTLPQDFGTLSILNSMIGGGALTASFQGSLDALPENCGSGNPNNFPTVPQPPGLKVTVKDQVDPSEIDFGSSAVVLRNEQGKKFVDCTDAGNRALITKYVTITNVSGQDKTIQFGQPKDSDSDSSSPLCGGFAEFVRGTITTQGSASCDPVVVAGHSYLTGSCKFPAGDASASVSFPLMYLPFNYQEPPAGASPIQDVGLFSLNYGGDSPFIMRLKGRTVPDFRDVFSVSKILNGVDSLKLVQNKGTLKIPLEKDHTGPFSQPLVLKNSGSDSWEAVTFTFGDGTHFAIEPPLVNRLPAAEGDVSGRMEMGLNFTPGKAAVYNDTLTIKMRKVGSITTDAPQGIEASLTINLLGTVGVPILSGNVKIQFDFLAALIDHVALDEPTESIDYREFPDLAPEPLEMNFKDTDREDVKEIEVKSKVVDILDPSLSVAERMKVLRVFNSRATVGKHGERLTSGDNSDKCFEPVSLNVPYVNGECSYFYHNILDSGVGIYDDDSGHMTLPDIRLRMQNPYHADIVGKWPASNPMGHPTYMLDDVLQLSFTTHILDRKVTEDAGRTVVLVPDERITAQDLVVKSKPLGRDCPDGIFDGVHPAFSCYLSSGDRFLQGHEVTLKPNQTKYYDVVLVGVAQFPTSQEDPNLPWFLGENGGTKILITIQGRMYKDE